MMALILLIIFLVAVVIAVRFLRNRKRSNVSGNRYTAYTSKRSSNPRVRANRYHRQNQREPSLGYKHTKGLEDIEESSVEPQPEKTAAKPEPSSVSIVSLSDDPDIVLGLKEEATLDEETTLKEAEQMVLRPSPMPPPIITFHVMAMQDRPYTGYELLQAILSVGMRYGKHRIFHRHQETTGRGKVLFSLASVTRPGFFDLPKMGAFSTVGLSLFFKANNVDDPLAVYELMLQTSGQLVEDLGGRVLEERHQLLTPAIVIEQRRRLREYMDCQHVPDLFESVET